MAVIVRRVDIRDNHAASGTVFQFDNIAVMNLNCRGLPMAAHTGNLQKTKRADKWDIGDAVPYRVNQIRKHEIGDLYHLNSLFPDKNRF